MEGEAKVETEQPPVVENAKQHKKGEPREKRPRPQRKNEYQYNADIIDQNTVIPPLPKKGELIPKPDVKVIKQREQKNNAKIEEIIQKKKNIRAEKFKFNRNQAGGQGDNKHTTFKSQVSEVQQLRDKFNEVKIERNELRDRLHKAIEQAKANNEKIKQYRGALKGSRENFADKLEELEHRLLTADISKDEEKNLNNEIMLLKRKLREAESSGNIEGKLEHCEDRKDELDEEISKIKSQKDPLEQEYTRIKGELDARQGKISELKGELAAEKSEKTEQKERHDKEYEAWKVQKAKRLQKLQADITKIKEDNKKIWDDYHQKQDDYWKQKQLIDFIEWQNRVKSRKVNQKEREIRQSEYQKRDQEREKEQHLKKYLGEIELINFLITYLNNLRIENVKVEEKKEVKVDKAELAAKMSSDKEWNRQKGLIVMESKKSKEDQEPEKKYKKQKKRKQETKTEEKFTIPYNVQTMFESLRVLAPTSAQEIDNKIKELRDRQQLFIRVSVEQPDAEDQKLVDEIKNKGNKSSSQKTKKEEQDFPTI